MRLKDTLKIIALFLMMAVSVAAQNTALKTRLDAVINQAVESEKIVGATIVAAQDGKIIYRRTAGFNDREAKRKLRQTDIFRLASLTKLIVSATALTLVDEGKLSLDDAVTKYIPDFRPKTSNGETPAITVRHLLTHTAGLNYSFAENPNAEYHRLQISDGLDNTGISLAENVRRIGSATLLFAPGTNWNYAVSIDVLGLVLEKASGKNLSELVAEKITAPLGMKDTAFYVKDSERLVAPYADGVQKTVRMTEPFSLEFGGSAIIFSPQRITNPQAFYSGGAGMAGTIDDYLKFLEAVRTGGSPILKPESAKLLTENAIGEIEINGGNSGSGFSLGASVLRNPAVVKTPQSVGTWSWGGVYGHSYFVDPQKKLTVVFLTNTAIAGMAGDFPNAVVNAIYGK
jgi:CubicO group peptidase (beta-lactamase class C family)